MSDPRNNLLLFFDRPTEPIFLEKGDNNVRFNIPKEYYPDEYKNLVTPPIPEGAKSDVTPYSVPVSEDVSFRFGPAEPKLSVLSGTDIPILPFRRPDIGAQSPIIDVASITLPDLSVPMELPKKDQFSFFLPKHRQMAGKLIDIFMEMPTLEQLQSVFAYCQLNINPYMFNYCASVAILHRPDTKGLDIPTFAETFPDKFVDRHSMRRAQEYCAIVSEGTEIPVIKIEFPVNPKAPEQRLWYFREDVGVNSHHWHWHLIYPTDLNNGVIVKKDRRGELFYYMHHQIMARYNLERMCNGLKRTSPLDDFSKPISEGYFPILDTANASRGWVPRFDNIALYDLNRTGDAMKVLIADMETWQERLMSAIENQSIQQLDGSQLLLDEETGIDILGNLVESTMISVNPIYYGDYHNKGHMLIAYVHDPNEHHGQKHAVMGDTATAMRDPVFYRWHAHIDDIFTTYKNKLKPYGSDKLAYPGISVTSLNIEGVSSPNTIDTLWERSTINVKNGLDFARRRNVYVEFTHLQHEEFTYVIEVNNKCSEPQIGTVRIFMAPTVDECGKPLSFEDQRILAIEMDKFSYKLVVGYNKIRRCSVNSSVTIPFERIYRDRRGQSASSVSSGVNYCDCGWPQYMLVPKGTTEGYPMVMFVMISNWNEDKVERDLTGADNDNASYCGLRDQKYPDRRAMGFPFDRKPAPSIDCFKKFLQPNMAITNCTIKFTDRTRDRVHKPQGDGKPPHGEEKPPQGEEKPPHGHECDGKDPEQCHQSGPHEHRHCGRCGSQKCTCSGSEHSNSGSQHCYRGGFGGGRCERPGFGGGHCRPHKEEEDKESGHGHGWGGGPPHHNHHHPQHHESGHIHG